MLDDSGKRRLENASNLRSPIEIQWMWNRYGTQQVHTWPSLEPETE